MRIKSPFLILGLALSTIFSNCSKKDKIEQEVLKVTQEVLIANYPLIIDGVDLTGNNAVMRLQNTPFQNGGVYCNGIYDYSATPNSCIARTPPIKSFNLYSFSISMDFFVSERRNHPVWVIGRSCRWLGFYLVDDGTIKLLYNNANLLNLQTTYSLNEWHNAKISYNGTTVNIFLDNSLAGSIKFGNGYVSLYNEKCGPDDTEIGATNYSNGEVFKGYIRNLKVYNIQ